VSTETLKPCPFCGGEAALMQSAAKDIFVRCQSCRIETDGRKTQAEAIAAWNSRAATTAGPSEREKALEAGRKGAEWAFNRVNEAQARLGMQVWAAESCASDYALPSADGKDGE